MSPAHRPEGAEDRGDRTRQARAEALVYVQKLTKVYPVQRGLLRRPELLHALNGVSFYVRHRETFGLVGESGCGKSTLGRCLIRLTEPTVGRVIFDGRDITAIRPGELRVMRQRMQIVFQDPYSSLNPNMTVREIVGEGIDIFKLAKSRAETDERVASLLERVGLPVERMDCYPHELSGGQRQRIAVARALAVEPDFIVLDEPLSALDLSIQAQMLNLLDDLQQTLGLSLLFISHDLRSVQYLSHRMAVMYRGKFMETGPTEAIARLQYHPYTRALFGAMPAGFWSRRRGPPSSRRGPPSTRGDADNPYRLVAGTPPSPLRPPRGCPLFSRCPRAELKRCDTDEPELIEIESRSHHRVACWHPHLE